MRSSRQSAAAAAAVAASKAFGGIEYYRLPATRRYGADDVMSDVTDDSDADSTSTDRSDADDSADADMFVGDDANSDDDSDVADLLAYERASEYPYRQPRTDPIRYQCAIPQDETMPSTRARDTERDAVWSPRSLSASSVSRFIASARAVCGDGALSDERLFDALKSAQYDVDVALMQLIRPLSDANTVGAVSERLRALDAAAARRRCVYQEKLLAAIAHAETITKASKSHSAVAAAPSAPYDVHQLRSLIQALSDAIETVAAINKPSANETLFTLTRALAVTDQVIDRARIILTALPTRQHYHHQQQQQQQRDKYTPVTLEDLRQVADADSVVTISVISSKEYRRIRALMDRAALVVTPLQRLQSAVDDFQSARPQRRLDDPDDVINAFIQDKSTDDSAHALNTLIGTVRDTFDAITKTALETSVSPAHADDGSSSPQTEQPLSPRSDDYEREVDMSVSSDVRRLEAAEFVRLIRHCAFLCGGLSVGEIDWLSVLHQRVTAFVSLIRGAINPTGDDDAAQPDDTDIGEGISVSLLAHRRGPLTLSDAMIAYVDVTTAVPFVTVSELKIARTAIDRGVSWLNQAESVVLSASAASCRGRRHFSRASVVVAALLPLDVRLKVFAGITEQSSRSRASALIGRYHLAESRHERISRCR